MASAISCITNHAILPDYSAAKSVTLKYFLKYILPFNNLTIRPSLLKSYYIHEKENSAEAADISNRIAPEHLELFIERPFELLKKIRNAGAIFLGRNTPESLGDYMAGPNHTLPTGGTARFSSPLGVEDFVKRSSIIAFSRKGLLRLGKDVARFAEFEGLEAHGRSVSVRLKES